ncbi:unnamed protein product [Cercopithifilaria johnstoni]|uniref:Uncharacterized protein n=1 Tax=Cercopithifilaria johnstoni TaxID=2874296 RepID=A0A8J2LMS1_9BILA|nr:unnamed protein product [Cercopithifilaria johnstoni]
MFGDHGSFWRHLQGPFWEAVNAYGPDSDEMNPILMPLKQEQRKKVVLHIPKILPYPDAPSFCNYDDEVIS